jgi:hypothetical protein
MECVVRVIQGPDKGLEHSLAPGPNVIGRGSRAAVRLTPEDVSWEHAVITRDGGDYFVENLSALGTWIGEQKIAGKVRLRPRDKVRLSADCVLRLEPAGGAGVLGSRGVLAAALVAVLGLSVAAVFFFDQSEEAGDDWNYAYGALDAFAQQQTAKRKLPAEAVDLFHRAWRLQKANDHQNAKAAWLRLQIVLANVEPTFRSLELAGKDPKGVALNNLLAHKPGYAPTEQDQATALAQFVQRWLVYSTKVAATGSKTP